MKLFTWIKTWFEKELDEIVAPLENIKANIKAYVEKQEAKIEADTTKAKQLIDSNIKRSEANIKANTIVQNLEKLLGVS